MPQPKITITVEFNGVVVSASETCPNESFATKDRALSYAQDSIRYLGKKIDNEIVYHFEHGPTDSFSNITP
jgi:hypothetical protein